MAKRLQAQVLIFACALALTLTDRALAFPGIATRGFALFGGLQNICLTPGGGGKAGSGLYAGACSLDADWAVRMVNNNYVVALVGTNLCIDIQGGAVTDGAPLILEPCSGSPTQGWYVQFGTIVSLDASSGSTCLGVRPGSSVVEVEACSSAPGQLVWPFGFPLFINSDLTQPGHGEECISFTGTGAAMNDQLCSQYTSSERFVFTLGGQIEQVGAPNCLTVDGISNGFSQLSMQPCGGTGQTFYTATGGPWVGDYWAEIRSTETDTGWPECVDIQGANPNPATPVDLYSCNGTSAQAWSFNLLTSDYQ